MALTDAEKLAAYEELMECSFYVILNMNDTFGGAGESEEMNSDDVEEMLPLIHEYGAKAVIAYAAVKQTMETGRRIDPDYLYRHGGLPQRYLDARKAVEALVDLEETGYPDILFETMWKKMKKETGVAAGEDPFLAAKEARGGGK